MDFFPHRAPATNIASATSASLTPSATFIANTSSTAINLAELALNISGSAGTSGTSYVTTGPQGAQGTRGSLGNRGKNIYLLAASRSPDYNTPPVACFGPYLLYNTGPSSGACNTIFGNGNYYSTGSIDSWVAGSPIFTDLGCVTPASNGEVHDGSTYYVISGGSISSISGCSS